VSIAIPETNLTQIHAASRWVEPADRDSFWRAIVTDLAGHEVGEGIVGRAVAKAFRVYFHPPLETDRRSEPHHYRKLGAAGAQ
jgi:hypothetical protein